MQLKQLIEDDDAVSPVIGVILMVAITVILAAVIATFVLGLGEQVSSQAPQASFSFEWEGTNPGAAQLEVTHSGGETLDANNLYIRGDPGSKCDSLGGGQTKVTLGNTWASYEKSVGSTASVSAGNSIDTDDEGTTGTEVVCADGEVDVIWQKTTGEQSATLGDWEGPAA